MTDLERYIIKEVDPVTYYSREIGWNGSDPKIYCPFHKEDKPSFEIRSSDGSAYCYGCRTYIKSIVTFHMLHHKVSRKKSFFQIFDTYLDTLISRSRYVKLVKRLKPGEKPWKYLTRRGITEQTIRKYMLGYNGRIVMPVFNEWGYCVNLRQYDYTGKEVKIFSYKKGYGKVRLYPMTSLAGKDIVIFEGEMDTLLGLSHGLDCVTLTGGAESWKPRFIRYFRGKNVAVCMDNDGPGQRGAKLVITDLKKVCSSLVNIVLPKKYGKDFSDYMQHKSFEDFKLLMRSTVQHKLDKRGDTGEDVYSSEKGMLLELDKDKELIHLIIKVTGSRT